jgi:hypothetical protein
MDESESDDGALHTLFRSLPLEEVEAKLRTLRRLARFRGTVPPVVRAIAQALADDPAWPLVDHPIVRRILEAS